MSLSSNAFKSFFSLFVMAGLLAVAGCGIGGAGNLLSEKTADEIPWNSNAVILESDLPPDSLYQSLQQELDKRDFRVASDDAAARSVVTDPKSIGKRAVLEAEGNVASAGAGSELTLTGQVGHESASTETQLLTGQEGGSGEGERPAEWIRGGNKQRGYAVLVQIAQALPGATVRYVEQ
jgi:hypothetical protein